VPWSRRLGWSGYSTRSMNLPSRGNRNSNALTPLTGTTQSLYVGELTSKRGVPRSEPYTDAERLALLAEALEPITFQPLQLEAEIAESVMKDDGLDDVVWVDELEREPMRSALEAQRRDQTARTARDELLPVLTQLTARTRG